MTRVSPPGRDLGSALVALERRVDKLARASSLRYSSIDDGTLLVKASGSVRALIGVQYDGTTAVNAVNGPTPPTPGPPIVVAILGGLSVSWDGSFAGGVVAPMDFSRVEVHVSTVDGFAPSAATLVGTVETTQGGTVRVAAAYVAQYVRLRTRTTSGVASPATAQSAATTPLQVQAADLTAGAVTANSIAVGSISALLAAADTITTQPTPANNSARVIIDQNGVRLVRRGNDGVDTILTNLSTAGNGSSSFVGTISGSSISGSSFTAGPGVDGQYVTMTSGYIRFPAGRPSEDPDVAGSIYSGPASTATSVASLLFVSSRNLDEASPFTTSLDTARLEMVGARRFVSGGSTVTAPPTLTANGKLIVTAGVQINTGGISTNSATVTGALTVSGASGVTVNGTGGVTVNGPLSASGAVALPGKIQAGTVTVTSVANTVVTQTVSFGIDLAAAPAVSLTVQGTASATVQACTVTNPTASGFTISLLRTNAVGTVIHWIATAP